MPSKQSEAVTRHWKASRLERDLPEDERSDTESWGNLTAEPREVDYIETHIESEAGACWRCGRCPSDAPRIRSCCACTGEGS